MDEGTLRGEGGPPETGSDVDESLARGEDGKLEPSVHNKRHCMVQVSPENYN